MGLRYQSTISTALLPVTKKIKRKSKKYAELLEGKNNILSKKKKTIIVIHCGYIFLKIIYLIITVTDSSTTNRKATIRKFNASHLSLLVNQRGITMDKLHHMIKNNDANVENTMGLVKFGVS